MGTGLAWFTVESADLSDIAAALGVKVTGRRGPRQKFPLAARRLGDGRWLVISSHCDDPLFSSKRLTAISRMGRTFSGMLEEHVMTSGFAAWGKGRKAWSVLHNGDDEPLHLRITGKLPQDIAALKDAALQKQRGQGDEADADYLYELSVDLIAQHTGLNPDTDFDDGEFEQLRFGFWRELWRRTFWWRLLFGLLGGLAVMTAGLVVVAKMLHRILAWLGWW